MTQRTWATSVASGALGLLLATLSPTGCSASNELAGSSAGGPSDTGGRAPSNGGSTSGVGGLGASAGSMAGSESSGGEDGGELGGQGGAGAPSTGGSGNTTDKCSSDSDCVQVAGSCFVCEIAGAARDCVDKGAPSCDNGVLEPCEICELDQTKDCTELGRPGEFSGGTAHCLVTCAGWDTSSCSVCGDGRRGVGETCEGNDPSPPHTCADEGLDEASDTVLTCTDECRFDTTLCGGCSPEASTCLSDTSCSGQECDGAECKIGARCELDCAGLGNDCRDVRCNHDAECDFACHARGRCAGVICDSGASCALHCSAGTCDGASCKAGAHCSFDCHGSGSCRDVTCQAGADCDFNCDGAGPHCSGHVTCGVGQACSFGCNAGSDCSGLSVTCPSGSACTFTCKGDGSVCPKADCQEGSSCVFACAGGDCNAPICAEDACSGN